MQRAGAQVIVETKLDRADILIGEQAVLSASVTAGSSQTVEFPDYKTADTLTAGVEVVKAGSIDTTRIDNGRRVQLRRDYVITSFDSALYALPPMAVMVDGKPYESRSRLGLKVGTVPVDTVHVDQFTPPYDVTEAPFVWTGRLLWLSLGLWPLVIIIFLLAVRLSSRKPVRRRVVVKPPVPPFKKAAAAMEKLQPLAAQQLDDDANKAFFVSLTDIVRLYLAERYGFNAMEKTTQEITEGMARAGLDDTAQRQLRELFTGADFVKFAKQTSTDMERQQAFRLAMDFMTATRDEVMEQPKPEVRYVTYSDTRQHTIRVVLWALLGMVFVACTGGFIWLAFEVYNTYF